ncbi:MAG: hypothetical protein DSZ32_07270 [Gammaproteobacteria bacterium]|nr:MAG: hypothetical protein DSZ32_07270 [Gammaproteobacteria bacterium]
MLRLFTRFYLLMVIPVLILFAFFDPAAWVLERTGHDTFMEQMEGIFTLIEDQLREHPQDQWPAVVDNLKPVFTFDINIAKLDRVALSPHDKKRLKRNGSIVKLDHRAIIYKAVENSDYVLWLESDVTEEEADSNYMQGPLHLLNQRLSTTPESQWPEVAESLNQRIKLGIQLLRRDQLPAAVNANPRLDLGKSVEEKLEKGLSNIYSHTPDKSWVWKFGPIDERNFNRQIEIANWAMPALTLALANLLLVLAAWREIRHLRKVSRQFGEGDLDTRVSLGKHAALKPLADTFNQMAERVQHQVENQRELTNAVSHELRTPLSRMRFGLEMLATTERPEDRQRFHQSLDHDMEDLEQLVDEILTHSRFDRPSETGALGKQAVLPWLEVFLANFSCAPFNIPVQLETGSADTGLIAAFDESALARALTNLLSNACRHAVSRVEISLVSENKQICIRVDDDGPGIAKSNRERIFEPFTRLDDSRGRESGGYGLGLAIVARIAAWHGGSVSAQKSPLGGARFELCLPTGELEQ